MKIFSRVIALAATTVALRSAQAQAPVAIDQVDSVQQRRALERSAQMSLKDGDSAPELYPGETSDVGPQSVLRIKPRRTWIEAVADAQYYYTDNMFLTRNNKIDSGVVVSTAQIALAPTQCESGCGQFAPRAGYRAQWYSFGLPGEDLQVTSPLPAGPVKVPLDIFDFNAQTAFADLRWTHGNWIADAGFDFTRLLTSTHYDEYYREYVPRWGLQRLFPAGDRLAFVLGYEGDYRWSDADVAILGFQTDLNDRTDHSLFASATVALCRNAVVQPYYRFKYTHFTQVNQEDYLNSFGLAIYCLVCSNFDIRAFVGYDMRNSNVAAAEYHNLTAGGGVTMTIRF